MLDLKVKDFSSPTNDIAISVYISAGYNNSFQDINFGTQFSITYNIRVAFKFCFKLRNSRVDYKADNIRRGK